MENDKTTGLVDILTTTLVREEAHKRLVIDKLLEEVVVHHFFR